MSKSSQNASTHQKWTVVDIRISLKCGPETQWQKLSSGQNVGKYIWLHTLFEAVEMYDLYTPARIGDQSVTHKFATWLQTCTEQD